MKFYCERPEPPLPAQLDRQSNVAYKLQTEEFSSWISDLRDYTAKARILVRIQRLANGNPGDVAPVGKGISELRINYGPGYRVYYVQRGEELVILLCGGDKSSQSKDISRAKEVVDELEE